MAILTRPAASAFAFASDLRSLVFCMMTSAEKFGRLTVEPEAEGTMRHLLIGLSAVAVSVIAPASARAASAFDGSWTVSETCPPTQTDVRGYAWIYPAVVRNGTLSAQYQAPNEGGGSIRLSGRISADGAAVLNAAGTVGHAEYAVGHLGHGTPYRFHVRAQFSGSGGSGSRVEQRQCDFSFARS